MTKKIDAAKAAEDRPLRIKSDPIIVLASIIGLAGWWAERTWF